MHLKRSVAFHLFICQMLLFIHLSIELQAIGWIFKRHPFGCQQSHILEILAEKSNLDIQRCYNGVCNICTANSPLGLTEAFRINTIAKKYYWTQYFTSTENMLTLKGLSVFSLIKSGKLVYFAFILFIISLHFILCI